MSRCTPCRGLTVWLLCSLALLAQPLQVGAGQAAPSAAAPAVQTTWSVRDWTRAELWGFFEPPPGGGDPTYAFAANRLQAGVRRRARRYDATATLQYVQFGGLPTGAVGPGPLGVGAVYFSHAGRTDSHQVYLRYLNVQLKDLVPGVSVQVGRMPYASGGEAASGVPKIEAVKRQRVDARLVGEFDWSLYQRSFDGVRVDVSRPGWSASGVAFHPTQGGFEESAGVMMRDVTVLGGSATAKPGRLIPNAEWQVFVFRYVDSRAVTARADNSGRPASGVDLALQTFGTTLAIASSVRSGRQWDGLVWLAGQTGTWYEQTHRAYSVAVEGGHQWSEAAWRPWIRAGMLRASGDDDPSDDRHGTFFQMLPTVRRYSQTATYSQMNHTDLFAQALLRPTPPLGLRLDVHRIGLASARDRWYFGSGATQNRGTTFGFATRPSNGRTDLGVVTELGADYALSAHWSLNAFLGVTRGGQVVRRSFAGSTLRFGFVESVIQF
jgi:hypothetical protein